MSKRHLRNAPSRVERLRELDMRSVESMWRSLVYDHGDGSQKGRSCAIRVLAAERTDGPSQLTQPKYLNIYRGMGVRRPYGDMLSEYSRRVLQETIPRHLGAVVLEHLPRERDCLSWAFRIVKSATNQL